MTRRPEAARLRDGRPVSWVTLAGALGNPAAVAAAVSSLNRFLRQVLELVCVAGGSLSPRRAEAEGLTAPMLLAAERELQGLGLAFARDGGGLLVPLEVMAVFRNPGGLRRPFSVLGENLTVAELRRILAVHRAAPGDRRKEDVVAFVSDLLGRSGAVRELVDGAPEPVRAALAELRAGGGTTLALSGSGYWGSRYGLYGWHWDGDSEVPAQWLLSRGLVVPADRAYSGLEIPAEVELALRGRVFPEWEPEPPPIETGPLTDERHGLELVSDVDTLLRAWREGVPALSSGGTPARELKRLAQRLGTDEDGAQELVSHAFMAGLLQEREVVPERRSRSRRNPRVLQSRRAVIEPADRAGGWQEMSEAARWLDLFRAWRGGLRLSLDGGAGQSLGVLLDVLGRLPDGTGASPEDLARHLTWRRPDLFPDVATSLRFVRQIAGDLGRLGAGGAVPLVGLSAAGRLACRPDLALADLEAVFPPSVSECTVTSDHRIVVPGVPDQSLGPLLSRIAEVVSVQPARVYRLTEGSLARGLDGGVTGGEILDTLSSRADRGVPPNVASFVRDVAGRHGRLRVGSAAVFVAADDPALLAEFAKGRIGRSLGVRRIAPNVLVVDGAAPADVVATMRRAGLMPVMENERQPPSPARAPLTPRPAPPPERGEAGLDVDVAASLVATLRTAPVRAGAMSEMEVTRLASTASRRASHVEVLVEGSGEARLLELSRVYISGRSLVGIQHPGFTHFQTNLADVTWFREIPDGALAGPFVIDPEDRWDQWEEAADQEDDPEPPEERTVIGPEVLERRRAALARARAAHAARKNPE